MLSSWSCLLVTLLGALLAQNSEAAGVCGALLQQVPKRPLSLQEFHRVCMQIPLIVKICKMRGNFVYMIYCFKLKKIDFALGF